MKKKLLVLLIAVIPTLIPNLATAIAIELPVGDPSGQSGDPYFGYPPAGEGID